MIRRKKLPGQVPTLPPFGSLLLRKSIAISFCPSYTLSCLPTGGRGSLGILLGGNGEGWKHEMMMMWGWRWNGLLFTLFTKGIFRALEGDIQRTFCFALQFLLFCSCPFLWTLHSTFCISFFWKVRRTMEKISADLKTWRKTLAPRKLRRTWKLLWKTSAPHKT